MEQKLTNEEIARVFAIYQDTNMLVRKEGKLHTPHIYCGTTYDRNNAVIWSQHRGTQWCEWNEIFFEATPLSKISDEDAIEVAVLESDYPKLNLNTYRKETFKWIIERINSRIKVTGRYKTWFSGDEIHKLSHTVELQPKWPVNDLKNATFQYLILKGYAVPLFFAPNHWANGKTAIELNLAIEKQ